MDKKKILIVSDSPLMPTGFSKVAHYLAMDWAKKGHEVYFQGKNQWHIPLAYSGYTLLQGGDQFQFYANLLQIYIKKIQPDIVFALQDLHKVQLIPDVLKNLNYQGKFIYYYPLDMDFSAPWHIEWTRNPDIVVVMSDFAEKRLKEDFDVKCLKKIYHGFNGKIFKPMEPDNDIMQEFGLAKYKHIIGHVANNQFRKMTHKTILAFKEIKKEIPDACLLMHTPDKKQGDVQSHMWPIKGFFDAYKMTDIIINPLAEWEYKAGVTEDYIARFMSVFDMQLLLTGGEGCGIPILETMAMGIPNVLTDCTTSPELIGNGRGFLAKLKDIEIGFNMEIRAVADEKDAAKKAIILLKDENLRKEMGKKAMKFIRKKYEWNKIYPKWDKLFKEI